MSWFLVVCLLLLGLALIVKGGDLFVDAASWMAEKTGIPKFIIGATIVSVATTLPEMVVSCIAAMEGKVDMSIGNAIGSVTANIGLIMGIALVCIPFQIQRKNYLAKIALMLSAALIITISGMGGVISWPAQIILFIIFVLSMWDNLYQAKNSQKEKQSLPKAAKAQSTAVFSLETPDEKTQRYEELNQAESVLWIAADTKQTHREVFFNLAKFIGGTIFILVGSQLLVDNGSLLAYFFGVPERVIAVTIVAIGTSLPELVTTLSAIAKKQGALSIGNIIGANIIDLTLILPISSLLAGQALPVSKQFAYLDIPACLLLGAIALLPTCITKKFSRWQGVTMLLFYGFYLYYTTFGVS